MDRLALAQRYFDGWNAHDAAAIAATFAPGGTYSDPSVEGLDPEATGAYAVGLAGAFPDLRFELVSAALTADGDVAAQWVMRGTNDGPFNGLPPSGREIALPGADFIAFADGDAGIAAVTGYFDGSRVARDLGLDVIVQPSAIGPWSFGVASRAASERTAPAGAFSLTVLEARSAEEIEEVRMRAREIAGQLLSAPGFLSFIGTTIGRRMYTITAWETPEAARDIRSNPSHREAVGRMMGPHVASWGQTGIWAPWHLNGRITRCAACDRMVRESETCACGAALPTPRAYW
jgi:steroid delta-isomerase-like uncharacterized protein